ncbi:MAG: nucleoside-diphosphate sugar epimerase/dehydratase [Sphaerochaetaceae bacterium]
MATILLVVERVAINRHLFSLKASGKLTKRVLAIGYGEGLNHYIDEIAAHPEYGLRIIGQFDSHEQGNGKVEQKEGELMPLIEQLEPHIIVIGYPACASETEKKMIGSCYDLISKSDGHSRSSLFDDWYQYCRFSHHPHAWAQRCRYWFFPTLCQASF